MLLHGYLFVSQQSNNTTKKNITCCILFVYQYLHATDGAIKVFGRMYAIGTAPSYAMSKLEDRKKKQVMPLATLLQWNDFKRGSFSVRDGHFSKELMSGCLAKT